MSLKEFKKIGSNEKFTTFKHPNGSFLKVAHKGITKDYKKKLDSLPSHPDEMGMTKNVKSLSAIPPAYQEKGPQTDFSNVNNLPRMAGGGGVGGDSQPMWHGVKSKIADWAGNGNPGLATQLPEDVKGSPVEQDMSGRTQEPDYRRVSGNVESEDIQMARGGMVRHYAGGTTDVSPEESAELDAPIIDKHGNTVTSFGRGEKQMAKDKATVSQYPLPADQADPSSQGVIGPQSPMAAPVSNDEGMNLAKPPSYSLPGGMADLAQGYQTQLGGLEKQQQAAQQGAQANIGLAQQEATTYGVGINQLSNINNAYIKHYGDITNERQALMNEAASGAAHLDPQHYVKNMSTGDKILTGISLVLGGIGSGMTHGPNLAAEFLQRNIDRDIENQRMQLGVKQNLLGFNFQNSKDLQDAVNTTKLNSLDMVGMYLKRQAAEAQNPLQQSALLNQSGIIDQKAGELQNQIAMRRAFMQIGASSPGSEQTFQQQNGFLRMMGPEGEKMAKNREDKHIPGLAGQSSVNVSEGDRGEYSEMQNLSKSFQDAQDYLSKAGTLGYPLPGAARSEGEALKNRIELSIGKLESLNRFTHEEAIRYKEMIPDLAGTHFTGQDQAKLNTLAQELGNKLSTFKQAHGYSPQAQTPAEQAPKQGVPNEVERITKDGKIAVFDPSTKKFLRYK